MVIGVGSERSYRERLADSLLRDLLEDAPAILMTGARGTGKTTTAARHVAQVDRLDVADVAATYRADPDAALRRAARPLLVDEWQLVPEVLPALKRAVDQDPSPGQFVLAGSAAAAVDTDMWAGTGRLLHVRMFGLAERELDESGLDPGVLPFVDRLAASGVEEVREPAAAPDLDDYVQRAVRGGFPHPALHLTRARSKALWFSSYLDDLVTRDAAMAGPKDPDKLRAYLGVLALHTAGLADDKTLYDAAGINAKTAAGYDRLLQRLCITEQVPAWPQTGNRLKALAKRAKRYVVDTGLTAAAMEADALEVVGDPDLLGRLFDALGTAQIRAENAAASTPRRLRHLRTHRGAEIDLVVDMGRGRAVALEFKAAASVDITDARHLIAMKDDLGERFLAGAVLHSGSKIRQLADRVYAIPLASVWT